MMPLEGSPQEKAITVHDQFSRSKSRTADLAMMQDDMISVCRVGSLHGELVMDAKYEKSNAQKSRLAMGVWQLESRAPL